MGIRSAGLVLIAAAAIAAPALAATPAQKKADKAFAKGLKAKIEPVFKKRAPVLVLRKVTCVLPKNGTVVHCTARFSYPPAKANVVYEITARLLQTGVLTWTTTAHHCASAKTGKKLAC